MNHCRRPCPGVPTAGCDAARRRSALRPPAAGLDRAIANPCAAAPPTGGPHCSCWSAHGFTDLTDARRIATPADGLADDFKHLLLARGEVCRFSGWIGELV